MNEADKLARQVAERCLQREGTGPAWGIAIEDAREGYALRAHDIARRHAERSSHRRMAA